MKPLRLNRVIGLALGEQSALVAEVAAAPGKGGGPPQVRRVAEFRYPDGVTPAQPAELGAALLPFLRDGSFTAKSAVVGLPARWLIAKPKDVPPADPATLADLLRIQAEGEFSSEQRDLVYDYAADATAGHPKSVLLMATPQRYVDAAVAMCAAAKLTAVAVTPSAVALGAATAADHGQGATSPLVLAVGSGGAELTAQAGPAPSAVRHLRGPGADGDPKPFLGELRRAVSTLPASSSSSASSADRRMVLWGTDADAAALNGNLGFPVTAGELAALGVTTGDVNGDGRRFAAAVALAASAVGENVRAVDFLHPRLAAPKARRVPRWAVSAALAAVVLVLVGVLAYNDLQRRQATLRKLQADVDTFRQPAVDATAFVRQVSFAQGWHGGNPRYLGCLRDLTTALPPDGQTFVTSLSVREPPRPTGTAGAAAVKVGGVTPLVGHLDGKTSDVSRAQQAVDRIQAVPAFTNVKLGGAAIGTGRDKEVSFSVTFNYVPPKAAAAAAAASSLKATADTRR